MEAEVALITSIGFDLQGAKGHDLRLQIAAVNEIDPLRIHGTVDRSQEPSAEAPAVPELEGVITNACPIDEPQRGEKVL